MCPNNVVPNYMWKEEDEYIIVSTVCNCQSKAITFWFRSRKCKHLLPCFCFMGRDKVWGYMMELNLVANEKLRDNDETSMDHSPYHFTRNRIVSVTTWLDCTVQLIAPLVFTAYWFPCNMKMILLNLNYLGWLYHDIDILSRMSCASTLSWSQCFGDSMYWV